SCSIVASCSHCQASSGGCSKLRRSIVSSFGHDRPSDPRHLVGNGNGDELGRLLGQQPHDPGMLLRMLPGVSNNGCCTDDEQPSEIRRGTAPSRTKTEWCSTQSMRRSMPCCRPKAGPVGGDPWGGLRAALFNLAFMNR